MPLAPFARFTVPNTETSQYSGERLVNMFARPTTGVSQSILLGRSGLVQHANISSSTVRAITSMGGKIYAVSNGALWRLDDGTPIQVGTVPDGETGIAASVNQIALTISGDYYCYDGTSLQQITAGALTSAKDVEYMDGYFVVIGSAQGRNDALQISGLDDGKTFNALEFAFAEENADDLTGILRDHGELYLFGTETTQIFYNSGAADFPFAPNRGAMIEAGCLFGATIAKADNAVFWVRSDNAVVRAAGASPAIISTPEIKEELGRSEISGGFTFSDKGTEFYAVKRKFKTTLCFDLATGLWHERANDLEYAPWIANCSVKLRGNEYFGTSTGKIVTQSEGVYSDLGGILLTEAVSAPIENSGDFFRIRRVEAQIRNASLSAQDATPQVMMQLSGDGLNWGRERVSNLGGVGEYWQRSAWHSLGQYRRVQMRLRMTDNAPRDIYGVSVQYG